MNRLGRSWPLWGLLYVLVAPGVAEAQLPLPQIGETAPDVRLATDVFVDRVTAFTRRVEKVAKSRRELHERERERLQQQLRQYADSLAPDSTVEPPSNFEPTVAKRIVETIDREDELLAEAVELGQRALAVVKKDTAAQEGTAGFDEVVSLMLSAKRLEGEADAAESVSDRLRSLSDIGEEAEPGATLSERLVAHEWRLQEARVEHAAAVALELRARARKARERAIAARRALAVDAAAVTKAQTDLARVEEEVRVEKEKLVEAKRALRPGGKSTKGLDSEVARELREAERALVLSKFDLLDRRREALDARLLQARARALSIEALAKRKVLEWPRELSPPRISAQIATISQQRTSLDTMSARLREREEKLALDSPLRAAFKARRDVLDDSLGVLREARQSYEVIQTMQSVTLPVSAGRRGLPFSYAVMLTVLVVFSGLLLLTYGLKYIHRLVHPEAGRLKLNQKLLGRVDTAVSLLWPLFVLGLCAALLVWPIWSVDLTLVEAIKAIDHPLFYVDDTPVSVFSVVELLFAVWAAVVLSRTIREFLSRRVYQNLGWDIGLTNALNTLVHYVVLLIGIVVGVRFIGIGASSLAILFGILGIGIGFGLRNITENFISGLIILAERPIKIGDFIEIEGEVEGQIQSIRARSTTVVTRDNVSLIIPNSEFVGQRVTNWSHGDPKVRIAIPVGVIYGSDTDLVRKTLLEVGKKHGQVLKKPPPEVQFRAFGASSLDFLLLVWIDEQRHRFRIASDLHFAVDRAFRKVGLEIAFPQLDLHLKTVSATSAQALNPPLPAPAVSEVDTQTLDLQESRGKGKARGQSQVQQLSLPDGRSRGSGPHKPP